MLTKRFQLTCLVILTIFVFSNSGSVVYGIESSTVSLNCSTLYGKKICCKFVDDSPYNAREDSPFPQRKSSCNKIRTYYPSPFEMKNIEDAIFIQNITNPSERFQFLFEKYESQDNFDESMKWIHRVRERMNSSMDNLPETDIDWKYLSRYHIEMNCSSNIYSWNEWIEPLTIHTRHPHFFRNNALMLKNVDYILLQSSHSHYNNTINGFPGSHNSQFKQFLFDAGSYTWDSSLYWFCCGYQQVWIIK